MATYRVTEKIAQIGAYALFAACFGVLLLEFGLLKLKVRIRGWYAGWN